MLQEVGDKRHPLQAAELALQSLWILGWVLETDVITARVILGVLCGNDEAASLLEAKLVLDVANDGGDGDVVG